MPNGTRSLSCRFSVSGQFLLLNGRIWNPREVFLILIRSPRRPLPLPLPYVYPPARVLLEALNPDHCCLLEPFHIPHFRSFPPQCTTRCIVSPRGLPRSLPSLPSFTPPSSLPGTGWVDEWVLSGPRGLRRGGQPEQAWHPFQPSVGVHPFQQSARSSSPLLTPSSHLHSHCLSSPPIQKPDHRR